MKKRWFLSGTGILFTADQILKTYTEENLEKGEEKQLAGPIVLRHVNNSGLCLNFLSGRPKAVQILSLTAAGIVSVLHLQSLFRTKGFWKKSALSLMTAGAWSNTFDRFARGHVTNYIGIQCKSQKMSSITYNLADFFIAAGAALLSLLSLGGHREK